MPAWSVIQQLVFGGAQHQPPDGIRLGCAAFWLVLALREGAGGPAAAAEEGEQLGDQAEPVGPGGGLHHVVVEEVVGVLKEER